MSRRLPAAKAAALDYLRRVAPARLAELAERCPHGYHVTEGHCPTCDLDQNGKCGPYCNHDHEPAKTTPGGIR